MEKNKLLALPLSIGILLMLCRELAQTTEQACANQISNMVRMLKTTQGD
jgi:hypothetical protein